MNIIGIPNKAPMPVIARIVPTIILTKPTAFLVGPQKRGSTSNRTNPVKKLAVSSSDQESLGDIDCESACVRKKLGDVDALSRDVTTILSGFTNLESEGIDSSKAFGKEST
jgi:hypothetical protein